MASNGTKDVVVAFGALITIYTVWSAIDTFRSRQQMAARSSNLNKKLDLILAKLGKS